MLQCPENTGEVCCCYVMRWPASPTECPQKPTGRNSLPPDSGALLEEVHCAAGTGSGKHPVMRTLAGKGAAHRAKASPAVVCFCWILAISHHLALVSFRIIANHSQHGPFVSLVYFPGVHLPAYLTLPGQLEVNVRCHKTSPDRLPNHHLFHCSFVWLHFFLTV